MSFDLIQTAAYRELIPKLKEKVRLTQIKAAMSVSAQLIDLYNGTSDGLLPSGMSIFPVFPLGNSKQ